MSEINEVWDFMGDRILTVEEVANHLKVSEATIYRMAQAGEIPAKRIGRSWRFSQTQLTAWFLELPSLERPVPAALVGSEELSPLRLARKRDAHRERPSMSV